MPQIPKEGGVSAASIAATLAALHAAYPEADILLTFKNPFELLCAVILAARAMDKTVNEVTPTLFMRYPTAAALAQAKLEDVEAIIKPTGYYHQKAARLVAVSKALVERHGGRVPNSLEDLMALPGIGRKSAVMIINHGFNRAGGIAVDTHVLRVTRRLGWATARNADKVVVELEAIIPRSEWQRFQDLIAAHGRAYCRAPRPICRGCPVALECPSAEQQS